MVKSGRTSTKTYSSFKSSLQRERDKTSDDEITSDETTK